MLPKHTPEDFRKVIESDTIIPYNTILQSLPTDASADTILSSILPFLKLDLPIDPKSIKQELDTVIPKPLKCTTDLFGATDQTQIKELKEKGIQGWDREKWIVERNGEVGWHYDLPLLQHFIYHDLLGPDDILYGVFLFRILGGQSVRFHHDAKWYPESNLSAFYIPIQYPKNSIFYVEGYGYMNATEGDVFLFNPYVSRHGAINGSLTTTRLVLGIRADIHSPKTKEIIINSFRGRINGG